jgi:lysophospholipase L1-like esterase
MGAAAILLIFAPKVQAVAKIMPFGDSITRGGNQTGDIPGGYRTELNSRLKKAGYSFDFVGISTENPAQDMDPDHNGINAFRTDQVLANMWEWLLLKPDGVLVHIGTNDILQHVPPATAAANLAIIVDRIVKNSSHPVVFLSTIIPIINNGDGTPTEEWAANVAEYNKQVRLIARSFADQGEKVTLVDMNAELDDPAYYRADEGVHPNKTGYDRMGDKWFEAIEAEGTLLGAIPPAPINRVLHKSSTATSVYGSNYGPNAANDDDPVSIWAAADGDRNAAWTVDLVETNKITHVEIVTRQNLDQPTARKNFEVRASNDPSFSKYVVLASQGDVSLPNAATFVAKPTDETPYRYLRVAKTDGAPLTIAEVRAYTEVIDPPPPVTNLILNGGFESGRKKWTVSGRPTVAPTTVYPGGNGAKVLVFETAERPVQGIVKQSFPTQPGKTYQIKFRMGVKGRSTRLQRLKVAVTGPTNNLTKTIGIRGKGKGSVWKNKSITFKADASSTTLTFRNRSSKKTQGLNLLLDDVSVSADN